MVKNRDVEIAVIVPVYNCQEYIGDCLESLLAQTYTNWVAYCINDGSKDDSGKILDEYSKKDSRIKTFHKPNGGEHSARNYALDRIVAAPNRWISFVDGDDYISPFMFEHIVKVLLTVSDQECQYVRLHCQRTPYAMEANEVYQRLYKRTKSEYNFGTEELDFTLFDNDGYFAHGNCGGQISSAFIHSELIDKYHYRGPEEMKVLGDQVFTMKCATRSAKIVDYEYEDYFYRYNPTSMLHTTKDTSEYIVRCLNYVYSAFKESGMTEAKRMYMVNEYIPTKVKDFLAVRFKNRNSYNSLPTFDDDIDIEDYLHPIKYRLAYYYLKYLKHSIL